MSYVSCMNLGQKVNWDIWAIAYPSIPTPSNQGSLYLNRLLIGEAFLRLFYLSVIRGAVFTAE